MTQTILLVDDSEEVRRVMSKVLERAGYKVVTAASGPEALSHLDFGGWAIDLLLTDVQLGAGMNGVELSLEMHARRPGTPVLFISGVYQDAGPVEHFMVKPFTMGELVKKVREVLEARAERA